VVDDIADAPDIPLDHKRRRLRAWRESLAAEFAGEPPLSRAVRELIHKYGIPRRHFEEIISGVEMDLTPRRYQNFEELRVYCHRVASEVGLVSIEIFGHRNAACKDYAADLGLALQLTNILRDVAEDCANGGRVYLPLDDLAQFGYTPEELAQRRYNENFRALMHFEAGRAISFYEKAAAELPREDRRSMVAAEIMRAVYRRILEKMRREDFRVFDKRYTLGAAQKAFLIARTMIATLLGLPLSGVR
jgi:phytoene synthase